MLRGTLTSYVSTFKRSCAVSTARGGPWAGKRSLPTSGTLHRSRDSVPFTMIPHFDPRRSLTLRVTITPARVESRSLPAGVLLGSEGESDATRREYLGIMHGYVGPC
jgi:hypothetical protein